VALAESAPLDAADELRLEQMLQEYAWASFPYLGQNATRCLSKGDFRSDGWCIFWAHCSERRVARAGGAKPNILGFHPGFVSDVDAVLAKT